MGLLKEPPKNKTYYIILLLPIDSPSSGFPTENIQDQPLASATSNSQRWRSKILDSFGDGNIQLPSGKRLQFATLNMAIYSWLVVEPAL